MTGPINFKKAELSGTFYNISQIKKFEPKIEICLAGKSNVGKSSLLQELLSRKSLVKVSSKPGKTISLNYYLIDNIFYLVDLPGFGYAKLSKNEIKRISELLKKYFQFSKNCRLMLYLKDARREWDDLEMEWLDEIRGNNIDVSLILTKSDKLSKNHLQKQLQYHCKLLNLKKEEILCTSALKKTGIDELKILIEKALTYYET